MGDREVCECEFQYYARHATVYGKGSPFVYICNTISVPHYW